VRATLLEVVEDVEAGRVGTRFGQDGEGEVTDEPAGRARQLEARRGEAKE